MKPVEIVLGRGRGKEGEWSMEGVNLRYIISIYVNITVFSLYNYYMLIKLQKSKTVYLTLLTLKRYMVYLTGYVVNVYTSLQLFFTANRYKI
jgi:hypothetical protein